MSNPDPTTHGSETCLVLMVAGLVLIGLLVAGFILDAY